MDSTQTVSESAVRAARELRVLISRLRRRFLEASDSHELTPSQLSVLSRLQKSGEGTASDIAAAERVRPQAIAATLGVLDERGLVERRTDPADRRRQVVSLSRAGRELLEGRSQAGHEWLSAAMQEQFTEAERATVLDALSLLERLTAQ
ncbi:MarR family winged helix-turn-helix transcriptional regulator [Nocardia sp. alder85J]|uniref:MarR family winged helix-turn-helix transcriptional regulator n=1 Tax=Nocardia sp. alder85J TaxID=2862949 RepID=UPI001CD650DD|nr:MarR family transcriptional regulator [Nocardia sp. alder85J]MCX4091213.1 MarR family transcriptional regulator [Nocardia sp. alder85J]